MKKIRYIFILSILALAGASCEEFFNPEADLLLPGEENYSDRSNIYASYMGLLASLQELADDHIVLTGLRGDLMMPTDQAPDKYWQIYRNEFRAENDLLSPVPYYNLVMNCNDFLRNTVAYNTQFPGILTEGHYKQLIGGAVAMRAWAYLTIGKLYGEAAYYDYAMTGEVDLAQIPLLPFDSLIDELIHFMNTGVDGISGNQRVNLDNIFNVNGTIWRRMSIAADALMVELYLWDKDYQSAAKRAISLLTDRALYDNKDADHLICSNFFGGPDAKNAWHKIFSAEPGENYKYEALTVVLYSYNRRQTHDLQNLFSATQPNVYYLKPTSALLSKFQGEDYLEGRTRIKDNRGDGVTYGTEENEQVIYKYHCKDREYYKHDAQIYLYRAPEVHLMLAEALSAIGNYDAADHIINDGFQSAWVSGSLYNPPFDAPIYKYEKLHNGIGIRGRMGVPLVFSNSERFMGELEPDTPEYNTRRKHVLDSLILEETARELAFEGKRWYAMVRMARNSGNVQLFTDLASQKYKEKARQEACKEHLSEPYNWFIHYNFKR